MTRRSFGKELGMAGLAVGYIVMVFVMVGLLSLLDG